MFTCYTAEESQSRSVPSVTIDDALVVRDGYGHRDRLVELTTSGLDGHDGADHHAVAQYLLDYLVADRLGLFCGKEVQLESLSWKLIIGKLVAKPTPAQRF